MVDTNDFSSLAIKIKKDLIDNTYYNDVKRNLRGRKYWKLLGDLFELLSKITLAVSVVLTFAAGFYEYELMSFISGCLGISALILLHLSSYAMKESKERNETVNKILRKVGLNDIVDISTEPNTDDLIKYQPKLENNESDKIVKFNDKLDEFPDNDEKTDD